jgi:beta-glucosidase
MALISLRQQVAQTIVVRASGHLLDHQREYPQWEFSRERLQYLIQDVGIGGVLLFGGTVADVSLRVQQQQAWADIPLLVCADVEAGVGQRFTGATSFPPPMALSDLGERGIQWARQMGRITALEAAAMGINWLLAPVVDVQCNPLNPVIDVRAFGTDAERVAVLTSAFIAGAQSAPVLTTAKHFPGHGDTGVDSHLALPILPHARDRLETLEWPPFQRAIAAGVSAIMSGHILVPELDKRWPATLSPAILDGILRQQWHFRGLIVTDAMTMGALTQVPSTAIPLSPAELAVQAIAAGADIVLMPAEPEAAIDAICAAVKEGRISRDRIRQSVSRILQAKSKVCDPQRIEQLNLERWTGTAEPVVARTSAAPPSPPPLLEDLPPQKSGLSRLLPQQPTTAAAETELDLAIATPAALACATAISQAAVRGDRLSSLPLRAQSNWVNWIWTDSLLDAKYLASDCPTIAAAAAQGMPIFLSDLRTPLTTLEMTLDLADGLVVQVFVRGGPFRGFGGLPPTAQHQLVERLAKVKAIACFGSKGCYQQLVLLSAAHNIPCLHAIDQQTPAQTEIAQRLWGNGSAIGSTRGQIVGNGLLAWE